ncbi:MAG: chorismate synthase [Oscillospiraceae bacterium]|nr:chorismate synthase [Oscillospiraceae bacterium]
MNYTIFGESHGPAIGVTLTGVPAGLALDMDFIEAEMARRRPGQDGLSTPRREEDRPEILSGVFQGHTTGTPLCAVIRNGDTRSGDYSQLKACPRPSHGDYTGRVRYGGYNDYRGGGHFSGRLTAPLVFAGAVAKLLLEPKGVGVRAVISMAEGVEYPSREQLEQIVLAAKAQGDSVGGSIEGIVDGLPAGCGEPDLDRNVEGIFARHLFAVPAVKGVAFGAGFGFARMRGSQANDPFVMENGRVRTRTNHAGGINGGITNGMPVTFQAAVRPTPSIALEQDTVNLDTGEPVKLTVQGRHDPCILPRALPVIEAAAALAAWDVLNLPR